jgi:hypothetical protein
MGNPSDSGDTLVDPEVAARGKKMCARWNREFKNKLKYPPGSVRGARMMSLRPMSRLKVRLRRGCEAARLRRGCDEVKVRALNY